MRRAVLAPSASERDAEGRVTRSVAGNGLATTHRHNPSNGELDSIAIGLPWAPLRRLAYGYAAEHHAP